MFPAVFRFLPPDRRYSMPENLAQHALNEVVTQGRPISSLAAGFGQADNAIVLDGCKEYRRALELLGPYGDGGG